MTVEGWTTGEFLAAHWDWATRYVLTWEKALREAIAEGRPVSVQNFGRGPDGYEIAEWVTK